MDLGFHRTSSFIKKCLFLFANHTDIIHFYIRRFLQDITCRHTSGLVCFTVVVSDNTDLLQRNTAQETSQEDFKVNLMLAVSCTTLACSLIFMILRHSTKQDIEQSVSLPLPEDTVRLKLVLCCKI